MMPGRAFRETRNVRIFVLAMTSIVITSGCVISSGEDGDADVEHVLTREGEDRSFPDEAGGVTWKSEVGGTPEPISGGVSIVHEGSLVAMDGYNGSELWRYRNPEANSDFFFSSDRDQVAIYPTHGSGNSDDAEKSRSGVLVNTRSGKSEGAVRTRANSASDGKGYPGAQFSEFDDEYRLAEWHDQLQVLSLENGDEVWRDDSVACAEESELDPFLGNSVVSESVIFVNFTCAEHVTAEGVRADDGSRVSGVLALDFADGSEIWRVEEEGPEDIVSARSEISLSSDGYFLLQNRTGVGEEGADEESRVLSVENGEEIFSDGRRLIDFDSKREQAVLYEREENTYLRVSRDGEEQHRAEITDGCSIGPLYDEAVALENGVLAVCAGTAGSREAVHWSEWDGDDSSAEVDLGVEYDELTDIVAAPGAVVIAYERDGEPAGAVGLS